MSRPPAHLAASATGNATYSPRGIPVVPPRGHRPPNSALELDARLDVPLVGHSLYSAEPRYSRRRRSGIGGLEGLRDDGQMALKHPFDGLAHFLQQVPSIGELLGLGWSLEGSLSVGRRTIAADTDQIDAGMSLEPRPDGRSVVVRQEADGTSVSRSTTMVP